MRRYITCCCRHGADPDEEDPYLPVLAPRRLRRGQQLSPATRAGPRTLIIRHIEGEVERVDATGVKFLVLPRAVIDLVAGYPLSDELLRDALNVVAARRVLLIALDTNNDIILDWRVEEQALLDNPTREGEPEDGMD